MELLNSLGIPMLLIIKIAIIIIILMYTIFAVVLVRQVKLMTETLEVGFERLISLASYLHLLASISILFAAVVFL